MKLLRNNKEILKEVEVPQDAMDYIQCLNYELDGFTALVISVTNAKHVKYNREIYNALKDDHRRANLAFKSAIVELKNEFAPELDGEVELIIDYPKQKLVFVKGGGAQECQCNL